MGHFNYDIIFVSNCNIKIKKEDDDKVLSMLHEPNGYKTIFVWV